MKYAAYYLAKFIEQGNIAVTEHFSIGPYPNGAGYALFSKNALLLESDDPTWLANQLIEYYDIESSEIFWAMHQKVPPSQTEVTIDD